MNFVERIIARKELTNMINRVLGHLWTTGGGVAVAILTVMLNGRTKQSFAAAVAAAIVGALAKDK